MPCIFFPSSLLGELFTLAVLDREREKEYDLVVKATDGGGRSCQADVTLMVQDMNDNPPQFSTSHYEVTVFDNTTIRTPIAVIYAKDPDTGMAMFLFTNDCAKPKKGKGCLWLIHLKSTESTPDFFT